MNPDWDLENNVRRIAVTQDRIADALDRVADALTHIAAILPDKTEAGSRAEDVSFSTWERIYRREFGVSE